MTIPMPAASAGGTKTRSAAFERSAGVRVGGADAHTGRVGVVVIGRNEGERLIRCLRSAIRCAAEAAARAVDSSGSTSRSSHSARAAAARAAPESVVYVDSGSTDGSVAAARGLGARVVELDASLPFSAARARNAGFERLMQADPELEFVLFLDGDCELIPGWTARALAEAARRPEAAVICGRRRERNPESSVYNRLCEMEWGEACAGETEACGGDALIRAAALRQVGGYRPTLIAGEEPELCLRLRTAGWTIVRIDADMAWHEAGITRWSQWWRRNVRAGHAYAECAHLHRRSPLRMWVRQSRSNWFWGLGLPAATGAAAAVVGWWGLLPVTAYLLLFARVYRRRRGRGDPGQASAEYALFCILGKFAQATGQIRYHRDRLLSRRIDLIEYK